MQGTWRYCMAMTPQRFDASCEAQHGKCNLKGGMKKPFLITGNAEAWISHLCLSCYHL